MIWILNENLKIIKILHKYTMAQFVDKGRDIGTVTINAVFCDENLYLLDKNVTYYVLYKPKNTREILAKIEKVEKQDEEDADFADTIKLTGRFIISWFEKRVLKGTYKADNIKANQFIENLVEDCYKISDTYRGIKIAVLQDNISQEMIQSVTKEITGGTLFDAIQPLLEQNNLCVSLYPFVFETHNLSEYYPNLEGETNISSFDFVITTGKDRTVNNTSNITPIVLSKSLSNVKRTSYSFNKESYTNVAYVAGEGEGADRQWFEVQRDDNNKKAAWQREELWVDARDLQSQQNDGTMLTEEQYNDLIQQRATEKFNENDIVETYDSTMNTLDKRYVYGKDFLLGDWITVIDSDLKIQLDAQIVSVTFTVQNNEEIIDIELQYGNAYKKVSENFEQSDKKIENVLNETKYIQNITKLLTRTHPQNFDDVLNDYKSMGVSIMSAQNAQGLPSGVESNMGVVLTLPGQNWGFQYYLGAYGSIYYRYNQGGSISDWLRYPFVEFEDFTITTDQYGQGRIYTDLSKRQVIYVMSKDYRYGVLPYEGGSESQETVRIFAVNSTTPSWAVNAKVPVRMWYCYNK